MKFVPIVLLAVMAGASLGAAVPGAAGNGKNVAVVFASRYGSTEQTARWIAEGIGEGATVVAAASAGDLGGYDRVVLGSGIYGNRLHADMAALLERHGPAVKDRIAALFVVCGMPPDQAGGYLDMFAGTCGAKPLLSRAFNGWMKKETLSPEDYRGLENYFRNAGYPFESYDHTDREKCVAFGREIRVALEGK